MPSQSRQIYEPAQKKIAQSVPKKVKRGHKTAQKMDYSMFIMIILLIIVGLIALFTASYPIALYRFGSPWRFAGSQAMFAVAGFIGMLVVSRINYHVYRRIQKPLFLVGIILLVLVLTPLGINHNNATRWLKLPILGEFQPSELMKTGVILSFSYYAARMRDKIRTVRGMLPFLAAMGLIAFLLKQQPHLSALIIILGVGLCILFAAGMKVWYVFPLGILGSIAFAIAYQTPNFAHVRSRIAVWRDPFLDLANKGWQAANSFVAIGSGGFWGLGLGQGRQKYLYLPEPQNDFVFSAWCEETGFIGALLVMVLFAYLIYRGFYIARNSKDRFGCLIAVGITSKLALQTLINLFVVSGIFPVTGASLPFFSYGGTALIIQLGEMGILLNISRYMNRSS